MPRDLTWETMSLWEKTETVVAGACVVGIIGFFVVSPFIETPRDRQFKVQKKALELFDADIKKLNPLLHDAILYVQHETIPERYLEAARKLCEAARV